MRCSISCRPGTASSSAITIPKKTARLITLLRSVREWAASSSGVSSIRVCSSIKVCSIGCFASVA